MLPALLALVFLLGGPIPPELGELRALQKLKLQGNIFSGEFSQP